MPAIRKEADPRHGGFLFKTNLPEGPSRAAAEGDTAPI